MSPELTLDVLAALCLVRWLVGDPVRAGWRDGFLMCDWTHGTGKTTYAVTGSR